MGLLLLLSLVTIASAFNIQENALSLIQPDDYNNRESSRFFGYGIQYGFGSDDALKWVYLSLY